MHIETKIGPVSRDFDLNLAPIIDCLTVLITFLLGSTAFLSVGILDVLVPSSGPPSAVATPPPANSLTIQLDLDGVTKIKVSGRKGVEKKIAALGGTWDLRALTGEIESIKQKYPTIQSATLGAQDDVEYVQYIRVMETMRSQLPLVFLGGLE